MNSLPTTIVLVGPHAVGKSTTGRALGALIGIPFHEELGKRLAMDPRHRPANRGPGAPQPRFDERVFLEELARDRQATGLPRIVETWHPGNLAYAARSPGIAERFLSDVAKECALGDVAVVPLTASPSVLEARRTIDLDVAFLHAAAREALAWAHRLALRVLPSVRTDRAHPLDVAKDIARLLRAHAAVRNALVLRSSL